MSEMSILGASAREVAQIRYLAYLLFEENERIAREIDLRMSEVIGIINAQLAEIKQVAVCRKCIDRITSERVISVLRKRPRVDYSRSSKLRSNAVSVAKGGYLVPLDGHRERLTHPAGYRRPQDHVAITDALGAENS